MSGLNSSEITKKFFHKKLINLIFYEKICKVSHVFTNFILLGRRKGREEIDDTTTGIEFRRVCKRHETLLRMCV